MESSLALSLIIAGIGMSLLFLTLTFFYGLLSLLTAALRERPSIPAPATAESDGGSEEEQALVRAAVIAVTVARAQAERAASPGSAPTGELAADAWPISSWWLFHHQRQLAGNPPTRRTR